MHYCQRCLQPDTRPNTVFDGGICPACRYFDELSGIDWRARYEDFLEVVEGIPTRGHYDCVIGVSGGKDSTRQAIWIRDKLGMNPLLVCVTYPPLISTDLGLRNLSNLIRLGFDIEMIQPAPETSRQMMRHAFLNHSNLLKASEMALFSGVQRAALDHGVSLIFWGENPALQLGDLGALGSTGWDGNQLRNMNTLGGGALSWLEDGGFDAQDLAMYSFPPPGELERRGVQIVYLGWVLGDWSMATNGIYGGLLGVGFRDDDAVDSGDPFGITAVDENLTPINQMLKYFKYGFGRATDYANEAIRHGLLDRESAVPMVELLDGACSLDAITQFCEYIAISQSEFWAVAQAATNGTLFDMVTSGRPRPRFKVGRGLG